EQLELTTRLLPEARAAVENAVLEPESCDPCAQLPQVLELEPLLEQLAAGLVHFRPFFALQERRSGEFSNLRVCRELACAASGGATGSKSRQRGFDVELVRWGTAAPATPEDLAEA
ncbi:unnamed protein product, partial [Polarella glacialis]